MNIKVKVNKSILESFYKKITENKSSRSDTSFNNTTGFYGNYGSVKSFNAFDSDEDIPIKASSHMAVQLSVEAPPVDDPDYIPATKEELGLAANRISREVPSEKIEYFYRKLHKLLDAALDEKDAELFELNESIDYNKIHPMHKKAIEQAILQAYEYTKTRWQGKKEVEGMHPDKAALFALQNRDIRRYPDITIQDVIDELSFLIPKEQYEEEDEPSEESLADEVVDTFVNPPVTLKDISPPKEKKKKRIISKKRARTVGKQKDIPAPSGEQLDRQAEEEMMDMLATAYAEHTEMEDLRHTWNWDNYKEEAPYLNVVFNTIKILHELSYRVLQANYLNKYGGYIYDPDADKGGKKKGGFVLEKRGPTSRPEAEAMIRRINSDFGLHYDNIMRQTNILKVKIPALTATIERAMIGIFQRVPKFYSEFSEVSNHDEDTINEALGFFASVIAHKYKGESGELDRDLPTLAIAGIFKRCLLDLPIELGIGTKSIISLDALTKKKKQKTDKTYGFNLAGAMKRFEKLRKDPKIAKQIKKLIPKLILNKITETKTAIVTKKGSKYNFEDKRTGLGYELKATELKNKIKEYVDLRIEGTKPSFSEDQRVEEKEIIHIPKSEEQELKQLKQKLSKEDYEIKRAVFEMEKMISSGDWMHIAPLFGFSGAPGVRSWYLRYPERKLNILKTARSGNAPSGATAYLESLRTAREDLAGKLLDDSKGRPGVLSLMIDEITNKKSLSTSDQEMTNLLNDMKGDIQELADLYFRYPSYEEVEKEEPDTIQRLGSTPGGSLLRFAIGSVFDNVIRDIDKPWQEEMQDYLEIKLGIETDKAKQLSYYFTGLKVKPSKGDLKADKENLTTVAKEFIDAGIESEEFFKALKYSQRWLFKRLDRGLKRRLDKGKLKDNYYKKIRELTGEPLYKGGKINKKFYTRVKNLISGKNGAISSYLDHLAIEQFQQSTKKKIDKMSSDNPSLFNESLEKIIKRYL
jgi:hypothetical protein